MFTRHQKENNQLLSWIKQILELNNLVQHVKSTLSKILSKAILRRYFSNYKILSGLVPF